MTTTVSYSVAPVAGQAASATRGVAFLSSDNDYDDLNGQTAFNGLNQKKDREVRDRFDYWIIGGRADQYFHGWPNHPVYGECFVFKWKDKRACHRLYGFLCHPYPMTNARFQLCVLTSHATKHQWETDPKELNSANAWRTNATIQTAIGMAYPDMRNGANSWLN